MELVIAALVGVLAGFIAGMLGVGGGILFVPALVFAFDISHVEAEATSLVAIVPVALVGTWRQTRYGNVRLQEGLTLGVLATGGAVVGVVLANTVSEDVIRVGFALLMLATAAQLVHGAVGSSE